MTSSEFNTKMSVTKYLNLLRSIEYAMFRHHSTFQRSDNLHRIAGFGTIGSHYNKINENSEEKEVQRRKEVDDLISKYASKKKVSQPSALNDYGSSNNIGSSSGINNSSSSTNLANNNDYASIRYNSLRDNLYGTSRENLYGTTTRRRSSQYDAYGDPLAAVAPTASYTPNYASTATTSSTNYYGRSNDVGAGSGAGSTGPRRYLATSKSSTNVYLHPSGTSGGGYDFGNKNVLPDTRIQTRQQKTLSMHGLPSPTIQPRMSGGTGVGGTVLPSSSLGSFHHLYSQQGGASDWGWPTGGSGSSLLNHHNPSSSYHSVAEPTSAPVTSKGLGFWTNPSALIPVN
jgi:hypothetical protein